MISPQEDISEAAQKKASGAALKRQYDRLTRPFSKLIRWFSQQRQHVTLLTITTIAVNAASFVLIILPLLTAKDTPEWFLLVISWALLIVTILLFREFRLDKQMRKEETSARQLAERVQSDEVLFSHLDDYHMCFHHMRDAHQHLLNYLDRDPSTQATAWEFDWSHAKHEIRLAVMKFAAFLSTHTRHDCQATIMQIVADKLQPDEDLVEKGEVQAIFRSHPQAVPPEIRVARSPIRENSDFRDLIRKPSRYFFANDVSTDPTYCNPHLGDPPRYRSVIVWPIRITPDEEETAQPDTIGFLCVDSPDSDVFVEGQHVFLGAGFADSLWAVLSLYHRCKVRQKRVADGLP